MLQFYFLGLALKTFFSFLVSIEQQQQPKTSFNDNQLTWDLSRIKIES